MDQSSTARQIWFALSRAHTIQINSMDMQEGSTEGVLRLL